MSPEEIPLVVLGMHRSGTSMLMRLCNLLGVHVGGKLIDAREDNARGFWEHEEIVALDEKVFRLFSLNSQDVLPFPPEWQSHPGLPALKEELLAVVHRDLCGKPLWGLKDPRIGRLLPIWNELFNRLGLTPRFAIPFRHPLEVANSLVARDFISLERGLLMWMEYNFDIERFTRGCPRVFVSFDRLFADPAPLVADMERHLGLRFPTDLSSVRNRIAEFVDPGLRHQRESPASRGELPDAVGCLYDALLDLERAGSTDFSALDRRRADLLSVLAPCAETLYALNPPAGIWRQTIEAKQREIDSLRMKLNRMEADGLP